MATEVNQKHSSNIEKLIPPLNKIEERFMFIDDEILRKNISLALQYILVIIGILDKERAENSSIAHALHKNMAVYYATITEGCLHYCLKKYIEKNLVHSKDVMPGEWKNKECKDLFTISKNEKVCGIIRIYKNEQLKDNTKFITISRATKKAGILTDKLFDEVEKLRDQRNKIHLMGLRYIDNNFTKVMSQKALNVTVKIIERVEKMLQKINSEVK